MQGKNRTFSILSNTVDKKRHVRPNPTRGTQFPRARYIHSLHPAPSPLSPLSREKAKKIERLRLPERFAFPRNQLYQ